jgi:hypothetical protein
VETFSGQPVTLHGHRLIPFHQVVRLDFPGKHGGLVWNRPVSILETTPDGSEQVIPVRDITRQAILAILGVVFLIAWLQRLRGR